MFIRTSHGFVFLFVSSKSRGETAAHPSNTDHPVLLRIKGCAGCVKRLAVRGRAESSSPAEMDIWNSSGPQRTLLIQPKTEYNPPHTHTQSQFCNGHACWHFPFVEGETIRDQLGGKGRQVISVQKSKGRSKKKKIDASAR